MHSSTPSEVRTSVSALVNILMKNFTVSRAKAVITRRRQQADVLRNRDSIYYACFGFDSTAKNPQRLSYFEDFTHLRPGNSAASDGRSSMASCISLCSSNGYRDFVLPPQHQA